ncbi:MAG: LPS-assembly protein LptD [Helicobacter sp.]|nr:LPS-assembly protein LptD [Helicobacter sp.]
MFLKKSFYSIIFTAILIAPSVMNARPSIKHFNKNQEVVFEFLADDVEYDKAQITGKGNVTIINLDYFVTANKAIYDTQTREITLIDSVNAYKGNSLYLKAQKVKIKIQEDYSFLEPFYLQELQSGLWVNSKTAESNGRVYQMEDTTVSACSVHNPIWKIQATQAEYDANKEWLKVWHPRLCVYDVPILYFPYLSFSAGYKRKSGLLYPIVGNSRDDGFIYSQPIFIAPNNWWDMTFSPQVRTRRGAGFYNEIRVVDDKNQILWLNFGVFRNTDNYQNTYNLENQEHYGVQLEYSRKDLLTKSHNYFREDGLYVDISQISDIDYFRTQTEQARERADLQGSLLTSRLNYFLKSDNDYVGVYGRYYSDLEKVSNAETLQTLPEVQYHRQIDSILVDNFYYSFDYGVKNYTRPIGYRAIQQEARLPFIYTQSLLDDYVNVSISPVFYGTMVDYSNTSDLNLENGRYFSHHYVFNADTDLVKKFSNFGHTLNLGVQYTLPGADNKKGSFTDFFELPGDRQEFLLSAAQYFYDLDNVLLLSHKINQAFYFEDNQRAGELQNEIQYFSNHHWRFLSNIFYSHSRGRISEATHQIKYKKDSLTGIFSHFMREQFARNDFIKRRFGEANYINAGFKKEFEGFDLYANVGYDYKENYFKTWEVGIDTEIRCFAFGIKYASTIYPMLTTRGAEAKDDRYILLTVKFIPLLSSDVKISN